MQERYGKPKALEKASQNPRWTIILAFSGKPIFFYPSAGDKPMVGCDFSLAQPLLVPQIPLEPIDIHRIHIMAAASLMKPVKCSVRLSYRVAKRRKCLSRQKQRSMRLRCL